MDVFPAVSVSVPTTVPVGFLATSGLLGAPPVTINAFAAPTIVGGSGALVSADDDAYVEWSGVWPSAPPSGTDNAIIDVSFGTPDLSGYEHLELHIVHHALPIAEGRESTWAAVFQDGQGFVPYDIGGAASYGRFPPLNGGGVDLVGDGGPKARAYAGGAGFGPYHTDSVVLFDLRDVGRFGGAIPSYGPFDHMTGVHLIIVFDSLAASFFDLAVGNGQRITQMYLVGYAPGEIPEFASGPAAIAVSTYANAIVMADENGKILRASAFPGPLQMTLLSDGSTLLGFDIFNTLVRSSDLHHYSYQAPAGWDSDAVVSFVANHDAGTVLLCSYSEGVTEGAKIWEFTPFGRMLRTIDVPVLPDGTLPLMPPDYPFQPVFQFQMADIDNGILSFIPSVFPGLSSLSSLSPVGNYDAVIARFNLEEGVWLNPIELTQDISNRLFPLTFSIDAASNYWLWGSVDDFEWSPGRFVNPIRLDKISADGTTRNRYWFKGDPDAPRWTLTAGNSRFDPSGKLLVFFEALSQYGNPDAIAAYGEYGAAVNGADFEMEGVWKFDLTGLVADDSSNPNDFPNSPWVWLPDNFITGANGWFDLVLGKLSGQARSRGLRFTRH